ncbi:FAD-dependent oxidoreductase [Roseibium marinum]|uniref:Protoporphyrinogen oxidase n=1 Tax=Roseibium marinum TaxID=281252 RepID=A0A2S3UTQ4_9HYPH|nr:NAD(P)-binding protein [Roseibium marinum]POF31091.1 protoporphyrinogen oxidase [Roseibium marinum]
MKNFFPNDEAPDQVFHTAILGAGISGLVSASILAEQGCGRILVIDEYDHLGGNHLDWSSNGYTFDIGSLIFQDDSPLIKHFPELLPHYVNVHPEWARLNPQGKITAYPVSVRDDILAGGPLVTARILVSALYARIFQRQMDSAEEFARYWIGSCLLTRSGLKTYMHRFYGIEPSQIDIDLAKKRMLWISENASFRGVWQRLKHRFKKSMPPSNRQLVRPKEGFAPLYDTVRQKLSKLGVEFSLGKKLNAVQKSKYGFTVVTEGGTFRAANVVSTIPVSQATNLCGIEMGSELRTITLITLYFSFSGNRGFDQSIIYNFSDEGAWKRLTVYSDFYGQVHGREYFAVEVISNFLGAGVEEAEKDFRAHVRDARLFSGDLKLEGSQVLENAYPIYSRGSVKQAEDAISALRDFGILSFGRQGGFNYQPTARVSTIEAESAMQGFNLKQTVEVVGEIKEEQIKM